jgi:DNA polymerase-4
MRLRSQDLWASNIGLAIGFAVPRSQNTPVSRFGVPARGWRSEIKLHECQDNQTLIAALRRLWDSQPAGEQYQHPYFIGVQLNNLIPDRLHTLALFDGLEEEQSRTRLLATMDQINDKYGMSTLAPAAMLTAWKAAPTRIAFHSIPDLF